LSRRYSSFSSWIRVHRCGKVRHWSCSRLDRASSAARNAGRRWAEWFESTALCPDASFEVPIFRQSYPDSRSSMVPNMSVSLEMRPEREVPVYNLGVVMLAQLPQRQTAPFPRSYPPLALQKEAAPQLLHFDDPSNRPSKGFSQTTFVPETF
jgi:hypothetical protein